MGTETMKTSGASSIEAIHSRSQKLAIYIHWPYCKHICPYCDFNRYLMPKTRNEGSLGSKYISQDEIHRLMRQAFTKQLQIAITSYKHNEIPNMTNPVNVGNLRNFSISSLFFGGGTPSLAQPETIASIISVIRNSGFCDKNIEITLEANPTSIELSNLKHFKDAGVNRLSIGIQSLSAIDLKKLGRHHSVSEALACYDLARSLFDRVSFDLIYARDKNQTALSWREELKRALDLKPQHISLYNLSFEPGTPFYKSLKQGKISSPSSDLQYELYKVAVDETQCAALQQYEISNFAQVGHECQHNLHYWRLGDYIGIGPGAASRITLHDSNMNPIRFAGMQFKSPEKWHQLVENMNPGEILEKVDEFQMLTREQTTLELLLTGLRTKEGISKLQLFDWWPNTKGFFDNPVIDAKELETMIEEQFLEIVTLPSKYPNHQKKEETYLRATPSGLLLLDSTLRRLVTKQ